MGEGAEVREKKEKEQQAEWVAYLMNATGNFSKNPITVTQLLGAEKRQEEHDETEKKLLERAEKRKAERLALRAAKGAKENRGG
jgi:hypothetical protein